MDSHCRERIAMIALLAYDNNLIDNESDLIIYLESKAKIALELYGGKCESCAVKIHKFSKIIGMPYSDRNGNLVFAIIRDNRIVTIQIRRDNQNCSAGQFGVRKVFSV